MMKRKMLFNKILIQRLNKDTLDSGIVVGPQEIEPFYIGKVLEIGDQVTRIKVGDIIHTGYFMGSADFEDKDFRGNKVILKVIKEDDVIFIEEPQPNIIV